MIKLKKKCNILFKENHWLWSPPFYKTITFPFQTFHKTQLPQDWRIKSFATPNHWELCNSQLPLSWSTFQFLSNLFLFLIFRFQNNPSWASCISSINNHLVLIHSFLKPFHVLVQNIIKIKHQSLWIQNPCFQEPTLLKPHFIGNHSYIGF